MLFVHYSCAPMNYHLVGTGQQQKVPPGTWYETLTSNRNSSNPPPPLYRPQNGCTEQWVLWAPDIFFLGTQQGEYLTLSVYTQNTQNFVENSKMDERHKREVVAMQQCQWPEVCRGTGCKNPGRCKQVPNLELTRK